MYLTNDITNMFLEFLFPETSIPTLSKNIMNSFNVLYHPLSEQITRMNDIKMDRN